MKPNKLLKNVVESSCTCLKDGGGFIPLLSLRALPRSEQRETHFSTMIEVRVEADRAVPGRPEVDHGRLVGILGREVDVELVDATCVRRVLRPTKTVNSSLRMFILQLN